MRLHGITEEEVESAIGKPEHLESSMEGKPNAWMKLSDRFLRVTYKEEPNNLLVISTVKKQKGWR